MIDQIIQLEERLINAILYSDVAVLDQLLHAELIFINHLGMLVSKSEDLAPHLSAELTFSEIVTSDQQITVFDDLAVVSVFKHIVGSYQGAEFESRVRFLRTWKKFDQNWLVIAASSVPVGNA
ncbi:nuclear transport factor 2 family protein [Pedobacter sp. GR22-6]|uniref:nuclear transport factor 2 family protein n=1 Tax=Pedobacter sp. GR22-6 TaxID=3127957 RepID=UPI00307D1777